VRRCRLQERLHLRRALLPAFSQGGIGETSHHRTSGTTDPFGLSIDFRQKIAG
jgi:hypothetical protein